MLLVLAVLFIGCSVFVENFLSWRNMQGLALAVTTIGMVACTMLFCLAAGDFDLSIGSVVACAGVLGAVVMTRTDSIALGILAALGLGAASGFVNGFVVARMKINALITTLATMQIVRGLGFIISDGKAVGIGQEGFFVLGNSAFLGVPTPVWITAACFIVFGFILNRTVFGRDTLAVGGNAEAAHLAGIPVERIKIAIFTVQGVMAAFAGVVLASRMTSGQPNAGLGFELEVISACVLGGVSLTGGPGCVGEVGVSSRPHAASGSAEASMKASMVVFTVVRCIELDSFPESDHCKAHATATCSAGVRVFLARCSVTGDDEA